jgi:DNA replication protein DnaC
MKSAPTPRQPYTREAWSALPERDRHLAVSRTKNWVLKGYQKNLEEGFVKSSTMPPAPDVALWDDIGQGKLVCPVCNDTRTIETVKFGLDTGAYDYRMEQCYCLQYRKMNAYLDKTVRGHYRHINLRDLKPSNYSRLTIEQQQEEIDFFRANPNRGYTFLGPTGVSKTTFATALFRHAVEQNVHIIGNPDYHGIECVWKIKVPEFMDKITNFEDLKRGDNELNIGKIDRAVDAGLYVLAVFDEVDKIKASPFKINLFFQLIENIDDHISRLEPKNKPRARVVIGSNLTPVEFSDVFGPHNFRRLSENTIIRNYFDYFPDESAERDAELKREKDRKLLAK